MRLLIPFVLAVAVAVAIAIVTAPAALAQSAPVSGSAHEAAVVPAMSGEAVRITSPSRLPSNRESLRRFRGLRVYRSAPTGVQAIPARSVEPAFPTVRTASGDTFIHKGGSHFLVSPAGD